MKTLAIITIALLCGCATYTPSPSAKSALASIDKDVANFVAFQFDKAQTVPVDVTALKDYFFECATVIQNAGDRPSPAIADVSDLVNAVRTVGYTKSARDAMQWCLGYYKPFTDPRDSTAVLAEIAQKIRDGCPRGWPDWYLPQRKGAK